MGKNKKILSEDTVIVWGSIPVGEYRRFFAEVIGKEFANDRDFQTWLFTQSGKTLKETVEDYFNPTKPNNIEELLAERRFNIIAESNKKFIIAFDAALDELGYGCGGVIVSGNIRCPFMIVYAKTGVKTPQVIARIYIGSDGEIVLRFYFSDIDKHRAYIENSLEHIKSVFTGDYGNCKHCENGNRAKGGCKFKKKYIIDGRDYEKCNGLVFEFRQFNLAKLPDYIGLFLEFYPTKKIKAEVKIC